MLYVVTGASSGIGYATARTLAVQHNDVIAVARSVDRLESLKHDSGEHLHIVPADLSTESGRISVIEKAISMGRIDGIVHAAGSLVAPTDYSKLQADHLLADMNIHVTVPISLNNALADRLVGGRILYIDSYSAQNLRVGWSGYSIVKAAAQMAARAASEEMTHASVIRVFPGAVQTPLVEKVLSSNTRSPTFDLFKELESTQAISEPSVIGDFIADILVNATDAQLNERDIWDFSNPNDRIF